MTDPKLVERAKKLAVDSRKDGWIYTADVIDGLITALEEDEAKAGPTREEIETTIGEALRECVLGNPKTRAQILADAMSRLFPTAPVDEESDR